MLLGTWSYFDTLYLQQWYLKFIKTAWNLIKEINSDGVAFNFLHELIFYGFN